MCRNIRILFNFDPPSTEEEIRAAALQYVRKVSGTAKPARANEVAFAAAVDTISRATTELLAQLTTTSPPRDRLVESAKAKERSRKRFARA